jgi:hypothetical protein
MDRDLIIKYFVSLHYAVHNTSARWVVRIADDTLVNFRKLGTYIDELEARHDPLTEFVLKGHCCNRPTYCYPQGGAGVLMSRFAAETALPHQVSFMQQMTLYDDLAWGKYATEHGVPCRATSDGHFLGHSMDMKLISSLANGQIPSMPRCSEVIFQKVIDDSLDLCGRGLSPLNDLVFLHRYPTDSYANIVWVGNITFNARPEVFWWSNAASCAELCYQDNSSMLGRSSYWDKPRTKWGSHSWYP